MRQKINVTHGFLPAVVKLDLIICSIQDQIKIWCDYDQFQVGFSLLCSTLQNEESVFLFDPETVFLERRIFSTNRPDWYDVLARTMQY